MSKGKRILAALAVMAILITCIQVSAFAASTSAGLTVSSYVSLPEELEAGTQFPIEGIIKSNSTINSVTAEIYNSSKKCVFTVTEIPKATKYDLKLLAPFITFDMLLKGEYTFKITAKDKQGTRTLVNEPFQVTGTNLRAAKINAVVSVAKSQVGYVEGKGNKTKYGKWFGANGAPWCAIFVSWCVYQADLKLYPKTIGQKMLKNIIISTASCPTGAKWFINKGVYKSASSYRVPRAGDIIYFGKGSGYSHVGIVTGTSIKNGVKQVHTVEGNASNRVKAKTYKITESKIKGYACPAY